jgi:steroid delta-isomerase-like uncharacterized protein
LPGAWHDRRGRFDRGEQGDRAPRAYDEVWNRGDLAATDVLFAPEVIIHHALEREPLFGVEAFKKFPTMLRSGFPDLHVVVEKLAAEDDRVAARWIIHWTHTGDFLGVPPTNTRVAISINEILRVSDAKIREIWVELNVIAVAQRLGMIPPPEKIPRVLLSALAWRERRHRVLRASASSLTCRWFDRLLDAAEIDNKVKFGRNV